MESKEQSIFQATDIGAIPRDWEIKRIEDITSRVCVGFVGSCFEDYCDQKNGVPMIRTTNLSEEGLIFSDLKYVTKEFHSRNKKSQLVKGDIVVARHGDSGKACYYDAEFESNCLNVVVIRPDKTKCNPKFLLYSFKNPQVKRQIEARIVGSVQGVLNTKIIAKIILPLPGLEEQKSIADVLSDVDSKIGLNQNMNKTLEAIGQAIFERWFVDFEFPNEEGKPYKSSGGEMVYIEELGKETPKEWKIRALEEISLNFDSKRVPLSSREREKTHGNYPYYGATGILDYVNNFIFDGIYALMGEDGTVIDENGFPVLQLVRGKFWVNNHAHVLQGRGISTELLFLLLKNTNVQHIVTGAVQPKINQGNMNTLKFIIPDEACKSRLQKFVNQLYAKINMNNEQNQNLSKTQDLLLPKLMSGKIRVPVQKENIEA